MADEIYGVARCSCTAAYVCPSCVEYEAGVAEQRKECGIRPGGSLTRRTTLIRQRARDVEVVRLELDKATELRKRLSSELRDASRQVGILKKRLQRAEISARVAKKDAMYAG